MRPGRQMRRQKFAPTMRRGCDRIRVGSIAAKLSVSWRSRRCINSRAECAAGHRDIPHRFRPQSAQVEWSKKVRHGLGYGEGRNTSTSSAAKISSAEGSGGKRCETSPEEFAKFYPPPIDWIRRTLTASAPPAQTVASRGFSRLPLYFISPNRP
jgi:hypothetical protein